MPLTELGFSRRTFAEILAAKEQKARELFGDDIDTSELTPLGKLLRINAYDQAITEEEAENIYYSIFPSTATGQSLDRLCWLVGITRNPATAAEYTVKVTGTAGATVPVGFIVGTDSELTYYNVEEKTIGENGTVNITVVCSQSGEIGNVSPADISKIVNPVVNISSVVGTEQTEVGEEVESDYSLRRRFEDAKEGMGSCNEIAIKAALMRVPTVTSVSITVNDTDSTDTGGRPPRSFECYISGGDDYHAQIAETIFDKKPIAIKTYGTVSQTITDDGGYTHTIKFSHTADIDVYVRIAIKTTTGFSDETGKEKIRDNIRSYINGVGVGKPVVLSQMYGLILDVDGVQDVTSIELSTNGTTWSSSNITVQSYQNCVFKQLSVKQNSGSSYEVVT